jgi:hypothetical protein
MNLRTILFYFNVDNLAAALNVAKDRAETHETNAYAGLHHPHTYYAIPEVMADMGVSELALRMAKQHPEWLMLRLETTDFEQLLRDFRGAADHLPDVKMASTLRMCADLLQRVIEAQNPEYREGVLNEFLAGALERKEAIYRIGERWLLRAEKERQGFHLIGAMPDDN